MVKEKNIWSIILISIRILLGIVIAFFKAITEVAWGLASIFLLLGLLAYFKADISIITLNPAFIDITRFIFDYMMWFVTAFFIFFCFRYIKEAIE